MYKQFQEKQKQKQKQKLERRVPEPTDSPEPTGGTSDGSENFAFDDGVRLRSFGHEADDHSDSFGDERCSTVIEEREGKRTITKEIEHADGSKTITITVEDYGYLCGMDTPKCFPVASGRSKKVRVEPSISETITSSSRQSTTGISHSGSWDSRASVEQFEIVDMDTSESSSVQARKSTHGAVQAAAMSIIREMQEEEERNQLTVSNESFTATSGVTGSADGVDGTGDDDASESSEYCQNTDDGITFNTGDANYNDRR